MKTRKNTNATRGFRRTFSVDTNERIKQYVELAAKLAMMFNSDVLKTDARIQAALIGIAHGLESYDSSRSSELSWVYLKGYHSIEDAIRRELRSKKRTMQVSSWTRLFEVADLRFFEKTSAAENEKEEEMKRRQRSIELFNDALASLDERTADIVRRIGINRERQVNVARSLGISQSWCSRIFNRGLSDIRRFIENGKNRTIAEKLGFL